MQNRDFQTDAWKRFTKDLQDRLEELRELNDQRHDEVKTAEIRGKISEVKRILDLAASSSDEAAPE